MRHEIHPEADAEFAAAVRYYSEIEPELGVRFYREIEQLWRASRPFTHHSAHKFLCNTTVGTLQTLREVFEAFGKEFQLQANSLSFLLVKKCIQISNAAITIG